MRKNLSLGLLSILLLTLLAFTVSEAGAATITSPVANNNYSTTLSFTCNSGMEKALNASLLYNASGGAVSVYLVTVTNTSANQSFFTNAAVSITSLTEATTYNMTCLMSNLSDNVYAAAVKGITIDNTDPTITIAIANKYVDYMSSQSATCSCSDTIDSAPTTTRTLTKGNTGKTVTVTSSPYTLVGSDLNVIGVNTWTCACVDYTGNTNSESKTFTIQTDEELPEGEDTATTTQKNNTLMIIVFIVLAAIALVIIIVVIALKDSDSKSGKKRRRR